MLASPPHLCPEIGKSAWGKKKVTALWFDSTLLQWYFPGRFCRVICPNVCTNLFKYFLEMHNNIYLYRKTYYNLFSYKPLFSPSTQQRLTASGIIPVVDSCSCEGSTAPDLVNFKWNLIYCIGERKIVHCRRPEEVVVLGWFMMINYSMILRFVPQNYCRIFKVCGRGRG